MAYPNADYTLSRPFDVFNLFCIDGFDVLISLSSSSLSPSVDDSRDELAGVSGLSDVGVPGLSECLLS